MERETSNYNNASLGDFSPAESSASTERGAFRTLLSPVTLQWELTDLCNENCVHCYNYWRDKSIGRVSINTNTIYDHAVEEMIRNKVFHVTLTGGEPLIVIEKIYPKLQKLAQAGISLSLNSNLTKMNQEKAAALKSLGVKTILTSLISGNEQTNDYLAGRKGTYREVSRGIKIALKEGFWVGVNMVVTKKNLKDIFKTAEYAKSLGVNAFSATKASAPIRNIDFSDLKLSQEEFNFMLNELLRVRNELGLAIDSLEFYPPCSFSSQEQADIFGGRMCNAGKTGCTIGFDGNVRPCSHASQTYGNILDKGGLKEAWLHLQPWRNRDFIPDVCGNCELEAFCRGGCRTEAFVTSGSLKEIDPYAVFSKQPIKRNPAELPEAYLESTYSFNPGLKYRNENFGGIIYLTPTKWAAVDDKLYSFFLTKRTSTFQAKELAQALMVQPEGVLPTVGVLLHRKILSERR